MFFFFLFIAVVAATAIGSSLSAASQREYDRNKLIVGSKEWNREAAGIWDVDGS